MKEYEIKFLVSKARFDKLLHQVLGAYSAASVTVKKQINYYYDTEALTLHGQNTTLRVRQSDGGFLLQEKIHAGDGIPEADESEESIAALPFSIQYREETVVLQGSLQTSRVSVQVGEGIKIEFDENWYLGSHDYEIEIEYANGQKKQVLELCRTLQLSQPNYVGKSARFFQTRERMCQSAAV